MNFIKFLFMTKSVTGVQSTYETTRYVFFINTVNSYCYAWLKFWHHSSLNYQKKKLMVTLCRTTPLPHSKILNGCPKRGIHWTLITQKLWPPKHPYLNQSHYYLWRTLKGRGFVKNLHSFKELKGNIWIGTANISKQELQCVSRNIFRSCKARFKAGGQHIKTRLWNTIGWTAGKK
jgi:hypothetical protein